jgi:transmembrane sensor
MNPADPSTSDHGRIARESADWVVRQERGLSAAEQDAFSQWLAADSRHGAALAKHRWAWGELDRLTGLQSSLAAHPDPDLLRPPAARNQRPRLRRLALPLAAALAVTLAVVAAWRAQWSGPDDPAGSPAAKSISTALAAPCEQRTLDDGSVVDLNRGARLAVAFTAGTRQVRLERGEAHFSVAKDAARPFVVEASGVSIRAVGTAFNVRLEEGGVDVVVTEGRVQLTAPGAPAASGAPAIFLSAGQQALMPLAPAPVPPAIATLTAPEIEDRLVWQPRLLDFSDAPLADIVGQFNRHNPVNLILGSPDLAGLRLGATFRSDNVEGFVRLMESDFAMTAEWRSETQIVLRRRR